MDGSGLNNDRGDEFIHPPDHFAYEKNLESRIVRNNPRLLCGLFSSIERVLLIGRILVCCQIRRTHLHIIELANRNWPQVKIRLNVTGCRCWRMISIV